MAEHRSYLKEKPVRSPAYLREVASLSCYRCTIQGYTQACHGDFNKGMGTKTSDLTAWPGCCERPGEEGCHHFVSRVMSRDERRAFEIEAAEDTKRRLIEKSWEPGEHKLRALLQKLGIVQA